LGFIKDVGMRFAFPPYTRWFLGKDQPTYTPEAEYALC